MRLENESGYIEYDFKTDLNEEEGERYLPAFYQGSVIELKMIEASQKGGGRHLMTAFFELATIRKAKLVFLDCCPLFMDGQETEIMQRLHDFYTNFGFTGRSGNGYSRLWRIQVLPDSLDACFTNGYDKENDLHPVLLRAFQSAR